MVTGEFEKEKHQQLVDPPSNKKNSSHSTSPNSSVGGEIQPYASSISHLKKYDHWPDRHTRTHHSQHKRNRKSLYPKYQYPHSSCAIKSYSCGRWHTYRSESPEKQKPQCGCSGDQVNSKSKQATENSPSNRLRKVCTSCQLEHVEFDTDVNVNTEKPTDLHWSVRKHLTRRGGIHKTNSSTEASGSTGISSTSTDRVSYTSDLLVNILPS